MRPLPGTTGPSTRSLRRFKFLSFWRCLEDLLKRRPYSVLNGNRVVEVRHRRVTKGQALQAVLKRHADADALLVAGDDRTDEEMMAAIPARMRDRALTIWVGGRSHHTAYWVESNIELLESLDVLADVWDRRPRRGRGNRRPAQTSLRR